LRFTVRRPPTGEVSPRCHRLSGGDVACSVDVGVAPPGAAGFALEDRLALAVSGCDVPACGASLRRVRSRNLFDPAEGLVLQACDELAPTTSSDRSVEPTLPGHSDARFFDGAASGTGHRLHVEVLDSDHVEPPCEVGRGFLDPIPAPVRLARFQSRDAPFRLLTAIGTALTARLPLLQHLQPFRLTRRQMGCVQQFAGRKRGRYRNTAVDADHAAIARTGDCVGDMRKRDMPTTSPIASDAVGLDAGRDRPRLAEPHPPDLRHPHPTQAAVQPLDVMSFHSDLPKPLVDTGFSPRRAPVSASEEVLHRLREIPQCLLLHRLTPSTKPRILGAGHRQLRTLLHIARSLAARLPVPLLLHRQIPHIPRIPAVHQQRLLLLTRRQQSKPRHIRTVATGTDKPSPTTLAPLEIDYLPRQKSRSSNRWRLR
jgi:hypothetical protein